MLGKFGLGAQLEVQRIGKRSEELPCTGQLDVRNGSVRDDTLIRLCVENAET